MEFSVFRYSRKPNFLNADQLFLGHILFIYLFRQLQIKICTKMGDSRTQFQGSGQSVGIANSATQLCNAINTIKTTTKNKILQTTINK